MSPRPKSIQFLAIEDMALYGIEDENIIITCIPVGPEQVRARPFGFFCDVKTLRRCAEGLLNLAEQVERMQAAQARLQEQEGK